MFKLTRHIIRKILIHLFYKKYVIDNKTIQEDIEQTVFVRGCRNLETPYRKFYHLMLYYPDFAFIFFWRIKYRGKFFKSYFTKEIPCKIFESSIIEGGLICFHPFATVINAKSIGKNFQFRNGLTIGNKGNDNTKLPIVGNNVTVGANVVIIGDVKVGDNVLIGAGSVVVKDIPSNCVVAGNPARVIRNITHE